MYGPKCTGPEKSTLQESKAGSSKIGQVATVNYGLASFERAGSAGVMKNFQVWRSIMHSKRRTGMSRYVKLHF